MTDNLKRRCAVAGLLAASLLIPQAASRAEMIEEIKGADLLKGYRNMPLGDRAALKETLLRVSTMVTALPEIIDMDLNPVKVLEPGEGVRAVDARIKVRPTQPGWSPELLDLPAVVSQG